MITRWLLVVLALLAAACGSAPDEAAPAPTTIDPTIGRSVQSVVDDTNDSTALVQTGAAVAAASGFAEWDGRRVGLITHAASMVDRTHLADLIDADPEVELAALFSPEHGVRTTVAAGEVVADAVDSTTGTTVFSLYGDTKQPTPEMLEGVDILVYDLQDVGTRYYSYITTMGLSMQAAADADIPFVVLDRPNPQGGQVSGHVREENVDSFISTYPLPDLYGLTAGELASAIAGEGWLDGLDNLDLRVVEMEGWTRSMTWVDTELPWVPPSPSLTTADAALLYPALVGFEATTASYGLGTDAPFERFAAPWIDGAALAAQLNAEQHPGVRFAPEENGVRLHVTNPNELQAVDLGVHLLAAVTRIPGGEDAIDRPEFLDLLAGGSTLRLLLAAGDSPSDILLPRATPLRSAETMLAAYHRYPAN